MYMKWLEQLEALVKLFKKIPINTRNSLFSNGYFQNRTIMNDLLERYIILGRNFHLAQQKLYTFVRAVAQAALFYFISIGILYAAIGIDSYKLRLVLGSIVFAVNTTFLGYCLLCFHRLAFEDVLFETSTKLKKREYRVLGFIAKLSWLLESILMSFRLMEYVTRNKLANLIFVLEYGALLVAGLFLLLYMARYLLVKRNSILIPIAAIPDNTIQIHTASQIHEVNVNRQFMLELTNNNLMVGPIGQAYNPDYAATPPKYHIPLDTILLVQAGNMQIKYSTDTKKWINAPVLSPQEVHESGRT